jgi:hypothetical protein
MGHEANYPRQHNKTVGAPYMTSVLWHIIAHEQGSTVILFLHVDTPDKVARQESFAGQAQG